MFDNSLLVYLVCKVCCFPDKLFLKNNFSRNYCTSNSLLIGFTPAQVRREDVLLVVLVVSPVVFLRAAGGVFRGWSRK